ncbi:IclR family transcriptional regulator [Sinomonas mesophila]|uniref:IclR family transcriptional regulator n=1 Tax=Sinomonas mesophila TaxID=1531955 RepID=UPI000986F7D3|nr:IclR family transcriptional regulator [Sinomonas mesophila]
MSEDATTDEALETSDLTNKSVIKATVILSELGRHPRGITVTQLAQRVGMTRPTAFRLLVSLEQTGFVERVDTKYLLGWEMARLGRLADPHRGIVARVQPVLDVLADELNETIGYAVANGEGRFELVAEAFGSRLLTLSQGWIGRDFPLHASGTGKIVLADLSDEKVEALLPSTLPALTRFTITDRSEFIEALHEVQRQGYATMDNELEEGLFAVSVPVRDDDGQLIGVLSATGPDQRMKSGRLPAIVEQLRQSAKEIARSLSSGAPVAAK